MKLLLPVFLFVCSFICNAQENYSYVDNKALQIPQTETYSTAGIATYINENFTKEGEKIRAVYTWIINNIEYSKDSITHFNRWGIDPEINMTAILRRRKGVCENYAALFANILLKCDVKASIVTGYTNLPGNNYWNGHGWVAVEADKEWYLCDPTWDAGYASYLYFLVPPGDFIQTHMPFDPLWQLLEHPISQKDFRKGYFNAKKNAPVFHYKDSVAAYLQSDTLQQMESTARRMTAAGVESEDQRTWYTYNQMKVHIVQQEENMQLFNDAVADLNSAKKLYNEFVQYRNGQFQPAKPDNDIKAMFANIRILLSSSYNKMSGIGKKVENYQYDTDSLKENLDNLSAKVKMQNEFLEKYFAGSETERQKLLYQ